MANRLPADVGLVNRLYQLGGRLNTIGLPNFSGRRTIAKVLGRRPPPP